MRCSELEKCFIGGLSCFIFSRTALRISSRELRFLSSCVDREVSIIIQILAQRIQPPRRFLSRDLNYKQCLAGLYNYHAYRYPLDNILSVVNSPERCAFRIERKRLSQTIASAKHQHGPHKAAVRHHSGNMSR